MNVHDPWKDNPEPGWFVAYSGGGCGFASAAGWYFLKYWWPLAPWAAINPESLSDCFEHPFVAGVLLLGLGAFDCWVAYIGGCVAMIGMWRDGLHQAPIPMRGSFILAGAAALVLAHGPIVPAEWGVLWVSGARGFCIALLAGGVANGMLGLLARLLMPARTARGLAPAMRHPGMTPRLPGRE